MSTEKARGVILRTRPLTETSLIVQWLTADLGRLATVAKGARRPNSPFRGQLDLFYAAEFSFARSRRSELHTLREVKTVETHEGLRRNFSYVQQASYFATLIEQTTETETPLPHLFLEFNALLAELTAHPAQAQTVFAFEIKLLHELGQQPNLLDTSLSAGARQLLEKFHDSNWAGIARLRLSESQVAEIRRFLHGYLTYHLGKIPRGRTGALAAD